MDQFYPPERLKFSLSGEVIAALIIVLLLVILSIYIGIRAKTTNPLKKPKGILLLMEMAVEKMDSFTALTMGKGFEDYGGYLMGQIAFLALGLALGMLGLPTPMTNLAIPLSLGLSTFLMIHITSVRFTGIRYFKRYVEPIFVFLPINLLSMWGPLLSLSFRLFGNAIAGWVILALVNNALGSLGNMIANNWGQVVTIGIGTPLLHAYFDAFSAFIQSTVFVYISAILVSQERPEEMK